MSRNVCLCCGDTLSCGTTSSSDDGRMRSSHAGAGIAVAQVAWTNKLTDQVMPFMIQWLKDYSGKVDLLMQERKEAMQAKVQVTTLLMLHLNSEYIAGLF